MLNVEAFQNEFALHRLSQVRLAGSSNQWCLSAHDCHSECGVLRSVYCRCHYKLFCYSEYAMLLDARYVTDPSIHVLRNLCMLNVMLHQVLST